MENNTAIPLVNDFRVRNEIILLLGADAEGGPAIQRTLEAVGYPVLKADTAEHAGELFRSFNGAIRLLIIDMSASQKSIAEVIAAVRQSNPTLKVIVASKEVSPSEQHKIFISGVIELISKPVEKDQLLRVVHRIVEN